MFGFIDQAAHFALGWQMARSLKGIRTMTREEKVEFVMDWAIERETLQGNPPEDCGENCQRDLRNWRKGAERGVG